MHKACPCSRRAKGQHTPSAPLQCNKFCSPPLPMGQAGLKVTKLCHAGKAGRAHSWAGESPGDTNLPLLPAGLAGSISLAHGGFPAQHSPAPCSAAVSLSHPLSHIPCSTPAPAPNMSLALLAKLLPCQVDLQGFAAQTSPSLLALLSSHSGVCRITKFTAGETPYGSGKVMGSHSSPYGAEQSCGVTNCPIWG